MNTMSITDSSSSCSTQGLGLLALLHRARPAERRYAATAAKDSVVSRSIKNGQVKTVDLKDGAVTTAEAGP